MAKETTYNLVIWATAAIFVSIMSPSHMLTLSFILVTSITALTNIMFLNIPFIRHDRVFSAVSKDLTNWTVEKGVRLDSDNEDDMVYDSFVLRKGHAWVMYYRGGPNYQNIIKLAESVDGLKWKKKGAIRFKGKQPHQARTPFVLKKGSQLIMYFAGGDNLRSYSIYSTTSKDGMNWSEPKRELEGDMLFSPWLTSNGKILYYSKKENNEVGVYYATLKNKKWVEQGSAILPGGKNDKKIAAHACIVEGKELHMFYAGDNAHGVTFNTVQSGESNFSIIHAKSKTGKSWRKQGVVLKPQEPWFGDGIISPCIVKTSTGYRMYFTGYWGDYILKPLHVFLRKASVLK